MCSKSSSCDCKEEGLKLIKRSGYAPKESRSAKRTCVAYHVTGVGLSCTNRYIYIFDRTIMWLHSLRGPHNNTFFLSGVRASLRLHFSCLSYEENNLLLKTALKKRFKEVHKFVEFVFVISL